MEEREEALHEILHYPLNFIVTSHGTPVRARNGTRNIGRPKWEVRKKILCVHRDNTLKQKKVIWSKSKRERKHYTKYCTIRSISSWHHTKRPWELEMEQGTLGATAGGPNWEVRQKIVCVHRDNTWKQKKVVRSKPKAEVSTGISLFDTIGNR